MGYKFGKRGGRSGAPDGTRRPTGIQIWIRDKAPGRRPEGAGIVRRNLDLDSAGGAPAAALGRRSESERKGRWKFVVENPIACRIPDEADILCLV